MAHCPEPERLAAYLDGHLFPEQRERLEEHLARCGRCTNALAESVRFQTGHAAAAREGMRVRWAAAAALVAAVAVPTTLWLALRADGPPWRSNPRAPLIAATAEQRPLVPRLTGGFRWAPPRETMRSASALPEAQVSWATYAAADLVRRQAGEAPSADRLGALADAHLLAGDLDRALATLARATAEDPADPRLRSDLAAAYLARGQREGTAADFGTAVELSSSALAAEPSLIEARFNRALALEGLHLNAEARRAWESYLRNETSPQWNTEAKRHLRDIATPAVLVSSTPALRRAAETDAPELPTLVAAHHFAARRLVERELLPEWGAAVSRGDAHAAARALRTAAAVAHLYSTQTGEERLDRQVAEAEAARGAVARRLALGHRALAQGEAAIERMDSAAAGRELSRAASAFAAKSIPWRRASVELLVTQFIAQGQQGDLAAKVAERAASGDDDLYTRARLAWLQGLLAANGAETGTAIARYQEALAAFGRLGETEPAAWIHFLLSEVYTLAGNERSTWQHRDAAVAAAPELEDRQRSFGIMLGAATWSVLGGRPWLAEAFLDELDARGYASLPDDRAYLMLWRARLSLQLGNRERSTSDLAEAAVATRALAPSGVRDWLAAEIAATRGVNATSPALAINALSRALDSFGKFGSVMRLPGLFLQRSLAHRTAGDTAAAEGDLRAGIALLERQGRFDARDEVWVSRLDGAYALYDEMIALELARHRPEEAFAWTERARRHVLPGGPDTARTGVPITSARVARELEGSTTILSYALIGNQALVWQLDSHGSRLLRLPTSAGELASAVAVLDADLAAGEWTARSARVARQLHQALIEPVTLDRDTSRLVIVPDKSLSMLPFSALRDGDGAFLVESYTVEMAPSAADYLHARARWRSLADDHPSALVIGDPRVDQTLFPGLPPLPGAAEEAHRVAALYRGSELLTHERATRDAFVGELGKHSIVHLATHELVDDAMPSRSALALAGSGRADGTAALFADEIPRLAMGRTRTVVLASCGGAVGPLADPQSRLSIPRAFFAADVPSVVAALWPVGDRRSVELLADLHQGLRAGDDPASALRNAQLRLLGTGDQRLRSPATWAVFQAFGG